MLFRSSFFILFCYSAILKTFTFSIWPTKKAANESISSACDNILNQVFKERSPDTTRIGQQVTSVYCVGWSGTKEKPEATWEWLKSNGDTMVRAYGYWGQSVILGHNRSCSNYFFRWFQLATPHGRFNELYSNCKIKQWSRMCQKQFGKKKWLVQPADNSFSDWNPFRKSLDKFAPGGVTLQRIPFFLGKSRVFEHSFQLSDVRRELC